MAQAHVKAPLFIVGGASRAGRAIAARMGGSGRSIVPVVRRPSGLPSEIVVTAYDAVPASLPLTGSVIVNCAGTPDGDARALRHANLDIPVAWARRAAEGGAQRFVQLSSFSVFGPVSSIGPATGPAPASDYGRSKHEAELALIEAGLGPRLTVVRVPILVGANGDKLARVVELASRTGVIPAAPWPTPRSMLSYSGLAAVVAALVTEERGGVLAVADPRPYTPAMLAERMRAAGKPARILRVPRLALAICRLLAPAIHASLFRPSTLADAANIALELDDFERIEQVIDRLLVERGAGHGLSP